MSKIKASLYGFVSRLSVLLRSIKASVTLSAVAAVAIGIMLTTFVLVREAEKDILAWQRDHSLGEGVRTASMLARRVVDLQRALAVSGEMMDRATLLDPARASAFIDSKPVLRSMFSGIFVASVNGRVTSFVDADGRRRSQLDLADRGYFRTTVAESRATISEPLPGRISDEPVIILSHPLRDASGLYGVIGGGLRLRSRDLLDDIVDGAGDEKGELIVVTDISGRVLAHPQRSRIMGSIADEPRMADGFTAWLAMGGASGGAVEPSGILLRQAGQVLSVAGVPGPDWLVWRALPESELLAPLHAARGKALGWAAAIVAGASLLVFAIIGRLLRPLSLLQYRAVNLFSATDDIHAGWPKAHGEIGELARVLRHVGAERAQLEQFNNQVLAKLDSVMAAAPMGIMFTRNLRFELVSAEACRLLGRPEHELLGTSASGIFASEEDYERLAPLIGAAFDQGLKYVGEWQFIRADLQLFWGQLRGQPVEQGNPQAGAIWTLADVGDQVEARDRLEWSANHDTLTGLGNRKLLEQQAQRLFDAGPEALPASIVMIDLDRFKPINDSAGHAAGDAMLKAVAKAIASQVRSRDLVARLGGDEFVLLLEHCAEDAALRVAEKVREAITATVVQWNGRALTVGASVGVAPLRADSPSLDVWLAGADQACYAAKAAGRGTVRVAGSVQVHPESSEPVTA